MTTRNDGGLRPLLGERLRALGFHVTAIETGGTGRGIPDSHWCRDGRSGWIELKGERRAGRVDLAPEQVGWIDSYRRHGGRADVLVRLRHEGGPRKGVACDELWLMRGDPRAIRDQGLTDPSAAWVLGRWEGGPASWSWETVAKLLLI